MIKVINTLSGQTAIVSEKTLKHPVLGKNLIVVDDEQKSYIPEMYEPKSAESFVRSKPKRSKKTIEEIEVVEEPAIEDADSDYFAQTEDD
jgi:hypothetical protein